MASQREQKLTSVLEQTMSGYEDGSELSYMDDFGMGEIAYGAYAGRGQAVEPTDVPYIDDFSLGQTSPQEMTEQQQANRMLLWGAAAVIAFMILGPR